ncbi:MAG: class B sortase [Lachnospiraceae bacterium]|nr:class B sortase [Lachnospiraceae bacterium]
MTADNLTVAGRRFRTRADYEAALRDQKKIENIKEKTDLNNPKQLYQLFAELQSGVYRFETTVGNDFDDEIYEQIEQLKAKGITPDNAAGYIGSKNAKKAKATKTAKAASVKKNTAAAGKTASKSSKKVKLEDYDKRMQKQIISELKRQERRRRFVIIAASLVAVLCFGYFGWYYYSSAKTDSDYGQLAELKNSDALADKNVTRKNEISLHKTGEIQLPDILDEYKTLYEKNKRLIGWLKIDDTIIDYPVMQTTNNDYYLDHNFNQESDKNGSIFLDTACSVYPRSTNLIIYGHHMKSGKMFGGLQKYAKESYGKEHSIIQFDTIYEKGTYQVMYVFRSQVYNENDIIFKYYQFIDANSEEEFNSYMREMAALSLYDTGVTANYGDSLITLSTCDNSQQDGRFVVVAKRIG